MAKPKPICPCCHKTAEIASIQAYVYAHYCEATETILYSNGLLWSNDRKEITRVERARLVHLSGTSGEARQEPSQVISLVEKYQFQNRPPSA